MLTFSSEVFIIGVNPYVPVPSEILEQLFSQAKKNRGTIPVKGLLNGKPFIQTVVKFSGVWRLYLNTPMRKAAGIGVGGTAHVAMMYDPASREEEMPVQLAALLEKDEQASEAFEKFAPYRKKEILRYLNNLKSEESLARNVEKVMKYLHGERIEGLIAITYDRNKSR